LKTLLPYLDRHRVSLAWGAVCLVLTNAIGLAAPPTVVAWCNWRDGGRVLRCVLPHPEVLSAYECSDGSAAAADSAVIPAATPRRIGGDLNETIHGCASGAWVCAWAE
jgi:hypothetical protein